MSSSGLNGSNSSTTSSATSNATNSNLVATNVMASLSSLTKSSVSPIVSQHQQHSGVKYEDALAGNYSSLNHQATHSQLNHTPSTHLQDNGTSHLLTNNNNVDTLASQHLAAPYHSMNQLSATSSSMGFHPLNSNVYANKSHLSANGFLTNSLSTINNGYNQFNHSANQINPASGYDLPVWQFNYDMNYPNSYNFCSS